MFPMCGKFKAIVSVHCKNVSSSTWYLNSFSLWKSNILHHLSNFHKKQWQVQWMPLDSRLSSEILFCPSCITLSQLSHSRRIQIVPYNTKCVYVCYNYQQIIKRASPSCWPDLGYGRVQRVRVEKYLPLYCLYLLPSKIFDKTDERAKGCRRET